MKWKQKGAGKIKVWGEISGGRPCKQLNIQIALDNTKKSTANAFIETYVDNYIKSGRKYRGSDRVSGSKKSRKRWFVDNINLKCLN